MAQRRKVKFPCIFCKEAVQAKDAALQCDACKRWQHLGCNTGLNLELYQVAVNCSLDIEWSCNKCSKKTGRAEIPPIISTFPDNTIAVIKEILWIIKDVPVRHVMFAGDTSGNKAGDFIATVGERCGPTWDYLLNQVYEETKALPFRPHYEHRPLVVSIYLESGMQRGAAIAKALELVDTEPISPPSQRDSVIQESTRLSFDLERTPIRLTTTFMDDTRTEEAMDVDHLPDLFQSFEESQVEESDPTIEEQEVVYDVFPAESALEDVMVEGSVDTMEESGQRAMDGTLAELGNDTTQQDAEQDSSFNVEEPINNHTVVVENSLSLAYPREDRREPLPTTYHYFPTGSKRGKPFLVESTGYSYVVRRTNKAGRVWRCSVRRGKGDICPASVHEDGHGNFQRGPSAHIHEFLPELVVATKVKVKVRDTAQQQLFRSAGDIVNEAMLEEVDAAAPNPALPTTSNLKRQANYGRAKTRPKEPKDVNFEINQAHIPKRFLRKDISVGGARHLLFATHKQLQLLKRAKVWYMDGTFKIVCKPFQQLFTIHAFIKVDGETKQWPLAFVLMTRRRKVDYKKVFKAVKRLLSGPAQATPCVVEKIVADFEKATWLAARAVFPRVRLQGCLFHYGQAVWRKMQSLGLANSYRRRLGTYRFCKKLFALPLLPSAHVRPALEGLQERVSTRRIRKLLQYVQREWLDSTVWPVESWSLFLQPVRTNNDTEGWHRRINSMASRTSLGFYTLVPLLEKEARLVDLEVQLLTEGKLRTWQRSLYATMQGRLFRLWTKYRQDPGAMTTSSFLRAASELYKPRLEL